MSRKPWVMTSATFAPLRSSIVLIAMVEPCRKRPASASRDPALCTPSVMPSTSRAGVVSVFPSSRAPEPSSNAATSVKVPPMSAAILSLLCIDLLGTDSGLLDDLAEAIQVGRDERREFPRAATGLRLVAQRAQSLGYLPGGDGAHNFPVQPAERLGRSAARREHPVPCGIDHRYAGFGRRRHIGKLRRAFLAHVPERAQLAGAHVGQRPGHAVEHHADLAREHR